MGMYRPDLPLFVHPYSHAWFDFRGAKAWGRYGFVDAFHPDAGWYSPDVIGIDQGIMLLMIENSRSGSVWDAVMSTAEARRGMEAVGLLPARA